MTGRTLVRALSGGSLILLVALLPALLAGLRVDAEPAPGEWQRLERALAGEGGSLVADACLGLFAASPDGLPAPGTPAAAAVLARARLVQPLLVLVLALLVYLGVAQGLGRLRGLLATAALALLPPVAAEGHVLRPEVPAAVFGLLALLLIQLLPASLRAADRRPGWRRAAHVLGLCATAATATGLAVAALPAYGILLLVPGAAMAASSLQLAFRFLRAVPRRRWPALPVRALAARLWPWVALAALAMAASLLLLELALPAGGEVLPATPSGAGLLPAARWLRWPLLLLAGLGTLLLLLRVGLRWGRRGRLGPDFLLGLHCAVLLVHRLGAGATDALPAAAPMAVLLSEGAAAAGFALRRRLSRPRRP